MHQSTRVLCMTAIMYVYMCTRTCITGRARSEALGSITNGWLSMHFSLGNYGIRPGYIPGMTLWGVALELFTLTADPGSTMLTEIAGKSKYASINS